MPPAASSIGQSSPQQPNLPSLHFVLIFTVHRFLMGRAMQNALLNMDLEGPYHEALGELGFELG